MVRSVAKPRVSNHAQAAWPRLDHASFETPAARAPQDEGANKAVALIECGKIREEHAKRNPGRACKRSFAHLILRSRPQVGVSKDAWFETRRLRDAPHHEEVRFLVASVARMERSAIRVFVSGEDKSRISLRFMRATDWH